MCWSLNRHGVGCVSRGAKFGINFRISNQQFLSGVGKCLAEDGEHGYKEEKLEPVVRQSDQSAVVEVLGNMSMDVCLFFEMGGGDQYEFSNCPSFARLFV